MGMDGENCISLRFSYQGEVDGPVIMRGWVGERSSPDGVAYRWLASIDAQRLLPGGKTCSIGRPQEWIFEAFIDVNGDCGATLSEGIMECEAQPGAPYGTRTERISGDVRVVITLMD